MESSKDVSKKILVVAAICFPPVLIGPAVLMGNLFRHFPKGSYHVLMGHLDYALPRKDKNSILPAPYTFARVPWLGSKGNLRRCVRSKIRFLFALFEFAWKGMRIIYREKIDAIFVVADYYVELPALFMHWLMGKKIMLYLPDLYYQPDPSNNGWSQLADRILEPFLLRAVNTVLVTAEPTYEYYRGKYGLETVALPHSVDFDKYTRLPQPTRRVNNFTDILFTGSVNPSQQGGILDMVKIVNEFQELNARFNLISNTSSDLLIKIGIGGQRVTCSHALRESIPALQRSADILFLPLSFEKHGYNVPSIVRTASPSKLPEYLAAGRPILIYAPPESYYAKYAQQEGFGLIVDKPDPNLLCQAIRKLQRDESLRNRLVANAHRVVTNYHDAEKVSDQLQSLLKRR